MISGFVAFFWLSLNAWADSCPNKPTSVQCFECFEKHNNQLVELCQRLNPGQASENSDFSVGFSAAVKNCMNQRGFVKPAATQEICMEIIPAAHTLPTEAMHKVSESEGDFSSQVPESSPSPSRKPVPKKGSKPTSTPKAQVSPEDDFSGGAVGGGPASSQDAQATQVDTSDAERCEADTRAAQRCCANPESCLSDSESAELQSSYAELGASSSQASGVNLLSGQYSAVNSTGATINSLYAKACFRSKAACNTSCKAARISTASETCSRLSAATYSTQSLNDSAGLGQGLNIGQMAQDQQFMNGVQAPDLGVGYQQLPPAQAANTAVARGEAGFQATKPKAEGTFNLADNSDQAPTAQPIFGGLTDNTKAGSAAVVPNNSGGQISGQAGQDARLTPPKPSNPQAGGGAYNVADLDQGLRSGGGYSQPGGPPPEEGSGGSGSSGVGGRGPASLKGVDLRQYLPGGALDPNYRLMGGVGGLRPPGTQIHGKHVDIWNRITIRMNEKCRLGELYRCTIP